MLSNIMNQIEKASCKPTVSTGLSSTIIEFPLFWKKKIQDFSSPIFEFSRCFRSWFAGEIYKIRDIHQRCSPFITL